MWLNLKKLCWLINMFQTSRADSNSVFWRRSVKFNYLSFSHTTIHKQNSPNFGLFLKTIERHQSAHTMENIVQMLKTPSTPSQFFTSKRFWFIHFCQWWTLIAVVRHHRNLINYRYRPSFGILFVILVGSVNFPSQLF